jgi:hypothetical protein
MSKLRLRLETLQVQSFDTGTASGRRGTVHGNSLFEPSHYTICPVICGGGGDPPQSQTCQQSACCAQTPNTMCEM